MNPWHRQESGCFFFPFKEEMWWESQYNIKEEDLSTVNDSVSSAWSILFPRSSASVLPQTCRRLPQSIKEDDEPRASRDISDCWWRRPALYLRSHWGFLHSCLFVFRKRGQNISGTYFTFNSEGRHVPEVEALPSCDLWPGKPYSCKSRSVWGELVTFPFIQMKQKYTLTSEWYQTLPLVNCGPGSDGVVHLLTCEEWDE